MTDIPKLAEAIMKMAEEDKGAVNMSADKILAARALMDDSPVPTKGRMVYRNGKFYDCDTGKEITTR